MNAFSLNHVVLQDILTHAKPYGHNELGDNLNLGFGFIYYGMVRALRPEHVLVIGSGYGFSVVCLALGLRDNGFGRLTFIDPSYSLIKDGPFKTVGGRGTWNDPDSVREHFGKFGVAEVVTHFKMKSEEFFPNYSEHRLPKINMAFVDGNHAFQHVHYDFLNVLKNSKPNSYVFLHDSNIYVREFLRHCGVKRFMRLLRREENAFEIIDFPFSSGVALVRVLEPEAWKQLQNSSSQ